MEFQHIECPRFDQVKKDLRSNKIIVRKFVFAFAVYIFTFMLIFYNFQNFFFLNDVHIQIRLDILFHLILALGYKTFFMLNIFICRYISFYEQLKFRAQLS